MAGSSFALFLRSTHGIWSTEPHPLYFVHVRRDLLLGRPLLQWFIAHLPVGRCGSTCLYQVKETVDATLNRISSSGVSGASYFTGSIIGTTRCAVSRFAVLHDSLNIVHNIERDVAHDVCGTCNALDTIPKAAVVYGHGAGQQRFASRLALTFHSAILVAASRRKVTSS